MANEFSHPPKDPTTVTQWIDYFTMNKEVVVPKLRAQDTKVPCKDISYPPPGTAGDPDLLIRLSDERKFYIKFFTENRIYYPLDLPTLYFPVRKGPMGSFWIVKDQYQLRWLD